jgi:hypothetical protein
VKRTILRPSTLSLTAFALLLACSGQVFGGDYTLKPKITLSEEYTDNVFDDLSKKSDFITRAQPGLLFKYTAPLWDWNLDYSYDYRYYLNGSRTQDTTQSINGSGLIKIIDEKLFLELSDVYQKVALNIARDTTHESLFVNQTDQNVGIASPYLVLHPTARLMVKTGYRYLNTWYKEQQGVSKQDHVGFLNSSYELTPTFSLTGDYSLTHELPDKGLSFTRQEVYLGPRLEYATQSFLFAKGGAIYTDYANGTHALNPSWSAGLTHTFDTAVFNLSGGTTYSDDPLGGAILQTTYSASIAKTLQRSSVILQGSYATLKSQTQIVTATQQENKTYTAGLSGKMELLPDLTGTLGLTYQNYHDQQVNGTTDRYFLDCGLNYDFGKELTAGLSYKYSDYSSKEIVQDNRRINRVSINVTKVF